MKRSIVLLIFDDVEVMDFAGPFEVFSVTNELNEYSLFDIKVTAIDKMPITARNGLSINPEFSITEITQADILIIPGGDGAHLLLEKPEVINWVKNIAPYTEFVLSVCSGSLVLAKANLLEGLKATTHHQVFKALRNIAPNTEVIENVRYIDNGQVITSAGISAGIDMSLYVIAKIFGQLTADATAKYMEYQGQYS